MTYKALHRVFDRVRLAPEREEAILADLLDGKREVSGRKHVEHKKPRVPAALAAAVLAAILTGTAFAAVMERLEIRIFPDAEEPGYTLDAVFMERYPLSAFSSALLEASETRGSLAVVKRQFGSWAEAEGFLGEDVPCVWPGNGWDETYRVYLFHTGTDRLWGVQVASTLHDGCVLAEITVGIRTECWQSDSGQAGLVEDTEGDFVRLDSYRMANGLTAEVIQYTGSAEHPHACCKGYFMREGMLYEVTAYGTLATLEETLDRLYSILDDYP